MKLIIEMNVHELSRAISTGTLAALVEDIKSHEDQVRNGAKPAPVAEPKPKPAPVAEPKPKPAPKQKDTPPREDPAGGKITDTQIRTKFVELSRKGKKKELKALLDELGAAKVSDITPEQYELVWAVLEAISNG